MKQYSFAVVLFMLCAATLSVFARSKHLVPYGENKFPEAYHAAVDAYFNAETLIRTRRYKEAADILKDFWSRYPKATTQIAQETGGIFTGHPPVYVALQMITRVADTLAEGAPRTREILRLSVLLPENSSGFDPASEEDARTNKGKPVTHRLSPGITAGKYKAVHEATWLFTEYLGALTGGKAQFVIEFVPLKITIPILNEGIADNAISSRPAESGYQLIWQSVPPAVVNRTDFWMIIFPSHKPTNDALRKSLYFTGGGMGRAPDGSPCIIIDDQFLLRAQPHFGVNEKLFEPIERQLYQPQFLQHEFYHHLFLIYPEFGLEATSHQWHKRSAWPQDFTGFFESDYYEQGFEKRIKSAAVPLITKLRFQGPSGTLWKIIREESLAGEYQRDPVENDWHRGTISVSDNQMQWKNTAGAAWRLQWNKQGELATGNDNPYHQSASGKSFKVRLKRDEAGKFTQSIDGFLFNNEFYRKMN